MLSIHIFHPSSFPFSLTPSPLSFISFVRFIQFANETASESPAPGGGSIAAYVGSLGASLGAMVANLSSHKRGWDDRWEEFSHWAEKGQVLKNELLRLVDEDTRAFNNLLEAFRLPSEKEQEKQAKSNAIEIATKNAIEVPWKVMENALQSMELLEAMVEIGNPNSVSDGAVGSLCARTAVIGAFLNVQINVNGLADKKYSQEKLEKGQEMVNRAKEAEERILKRAQEKIAKSGEKK